MFYVHVIAFFRWIRLTFFYLPTPEEIAQADPKERCPNCGFRSCVLRCVLKQKPGAQIKNLPAEKKTGIFCQRTCERCGCRWFKAPLFAVDGTILYPAVARNELEKAEDDQQRRLERESDPST